MRARSGRMAAFIVACVVAAGCSPGPAPTPDESATAAATVTAVPSAPAIPTSESLIAAALASGSITYEQSLLYRALALYNSPGLPAQFHSPVPDIDVAGDLFGEIDAKAATLGPGLLQQLAPYRARPSDPISVFNVPPPIAGANIVLVAATTATWRSEPAAGGLARVWVKATDADAATASAALDGHAQAIDQVWAAFPGLFTYPEPDEPGVPSLAVNPDSAIDFYFVDIGSLDPRRADCTAKPGGAYCVFGAQYAGFAKRAAAFHNSSASGYLVVDASATGDTLIDTVAHELTHASQYALDMNETSWLKESTATWVAYRVMKKLNRTPSFPYSYLKDFFGELDQTLTRSGPGNANSYASWLYFQFAAMEAGPSVVQDIWEAAAADGIQGEKAVDKVFPFDKHFAAFALRDWNKDPVQPQYKTGDQTFPSGYQPKNRNKVTTLSGGKEDTLNVGLPALASAYFEYVFPSSTRDITFQNSLANVAGAHVWAIRNVNDVWQKPEDWTAQAKKTFCRDVPAEDLGQVIIVVSNSSMTKPLKAPEPPKLIAGTKGCSGWSGTMTGTETWNWSWGHGQGVSSFTGLWIEASGDPPVAPCQSPLPGGCIAYLPHGAIHWTYDSHQTPGCTETTSGDFPAGAANDPRNAGGANGVPLSTQMFALEPDGNGHYSYWGLTSWAMPTKIKCGDGSAAVAGPPSYFDIPEDAAGSGDGGPGGNECNKTTWQIDVTATSITGSCYSFKTSGHSLRFEWTLHRVGGKPGS